MENNHTSSNEMILQNDTSSNETFLPCLLPHEITEAQWEFYYTFLWWLEGFGSLSIGLIGICFNILTICVLLGSELAASFFNWLLVCLSVFDSLFLLNGILEAFRNHFGSTNYHVYMFVVFLYPFRSIVMCCSMYITVVLALERYNALVRPISHQAPSLRTGRQSLKQYFMLHCVRLLKYILPIIILSTLFYIPKRLELDLVTTQDYTNKYSIDITELRSNSYYNLWYLNICNLLITAVVPLISLAYLNTNVYLKFKEYLQRQPLAETNRNNHKQQQRIKKREKDMIQQTLILFSVVILFGLFHILRIVLNIEEFSSLQNRKDAKENGCEWLQFWTIIASPVSHVLLQLNGSINFVIYCYFNKYFRDELISWINKTLISLKIKSVSTDTVNSTDQYLPTLCDTELTKCGKVEHTELNTLNVITTEI